MVQGLTVPAGFVPTWQPVSFDQGASRTVQLYTRGCLFGGWVLQNLSASILGPVFFDGDDGGGTRVAEVVLGANSGFSSHTLPWPGIVCSAGLCVVVDAAAFGVAYVADLP